MHVQQLPIEDLREAPWNANVMDEGMLSKLRESVARFGLVLNFVVRFLSDGSYEVLGGNQRLQVVRQMGVAEVPCCRKPGWTGL